MWEWSWSAWLWCWAKGHWVSSSSPWRHLCSLFFIFQDSSLSPPPPPQICGQEEVRQLNELGVFRWQWNCFGLHCWLSLPCCFCWSSSSVVIPDFQVRVSLSGSPQLPLGLEEGFYVHTNGTRRQLVVTGHWEEQPRDQWQICTWVC